MKTTKKRFVCAMSVAAMAATMLTVPAYSEEPPAVDGDTIRVEGESYNKEDGKWKAEPDITNTAAPGGGINFTSGKVPFDAEQKPYVSYTFEVEKAGIYDLEYVANYLKDEAKDCQWLSPFSVTVNDDEVMFAGDTPNNGAMISYKAPAKAADYYGTYKFPVYLNQGENKIKFTVEGGRYNGSQDYVFYLDYFKLTYNETATASDTIQVESEELIAGNIPVTNIGKLEYSGATDQTYYRFTSAKDASDGYLEYVIASPAEGKFQLELAGSNTDCEQNIKGYMGDYSIVINDVEDSKISVGSPDKQSSGVTSDSHDYYKLNGKEDVFYDKMHSNDLVTLKKGLNKVKVLLDGAAGNGNHVIDLDYLKFTPASEISPTQEPEDDGIIKVEGESYKAEDSKWDVYSTGVTPNIYAPNGGLNLTSGKVSFDEKDKPYASYTFDVKKAGIYDLEYVANYLKNEDQNNYCMYLSPFSVTVNDDEVMFAGDTPNNGAIISYKAPAKPADNYGTYKLPVYLNEGSNNITFTVEGGRYNGNPDYVFYLDYFRFAYNETATATDTIKVEAEELIAGNVPVVNIRELTYDGATDEKYYRFTAKTGSDEGYLEYVIAAPEDGEFRLELAGSNTDSQPGIKGYMGDYSVVINGDESGKISVGARDGQISGVTSDSSDFYKLNGNEDVFYDKMHSNNLVKLKKGLNNVKVLLDGAAGNGNHVIDLDYLKFTPASEISPTQEPEDNGIIRAEGENYNTTDKGKWTFTTPEDGQVGTSDQLGNPARTGMVLNSKSGGTYDDSNKPSATYTFSVKKAGIYDLEYVANYLKDEAETKDHMYLSPFSVTLNDVQILFDGDTPNNPEMIYYNAPTKGTALFGTYKLPVYLEAGENKITFTVEGKRYKGGDGYEFYLDYFELTYDEEATASDTIQVEAEDLIAGNVPSSNGIAKMTVESKDPALKAAAELASNQTMYQFITSNAGGYLEYIVPSAKDGDFNLEITGSNTDKTTGLKSWCGDFNVTVNGTAISVGEDVTSEHKADVYDVMTANKTVSLKKGLNKIRVDLDRPAGDGRYVIHLDYLKFTPASEIIPTPVPVEKIEVSDFIVDSFGVASASITNDGDAPVTVAVISVSYNADKTLASVKLTQKTIGSNVTETVKTDALENATSDTRAYVWNMNGNKPLNEAITPATE